MHGVAGDARRGRPRWPWRRASTSSCPTRAATASRCWSGAPTARSPRRWSTARRARVLRQKMRAGPARRRTGRRERSVAPTARRRPGLRRRNRGAGPASWPSESIVLLTPTTALPLPLAARAARIARRRPARRRPAGLDRLLLLPRTTSAAAPPGRAGLGIEVPHRCSTRCAAELPDARDRPRAGLRRHAAPTARASPRRWPRPRERRRRASPSLGDRAGLFGRGTSGEGCDAADLRLPGRPGGAARRAARHRHPGRRWSCSPGGPTRSATSRAALAAVVQAFFPGEEGGARHRRGAVRPGQPVRQAAGGGPALAGRPAGTYLRRRSARDSDGVSTVDPTPLFPFGHGLSYTTLRLRRPASSSAAEIAHGRRRSTVTRARCRNTGAARRAPRSSSCTCTTRWPRWSGPVQRLVGFARVAARARRGAPGDVPAARRPDRVHRPRPVTGRVVEPGEIGVAMGGASDQLPLQGSFTLCGPVRAVGPGRVLDTPAATFAQ